MNTIKTSYDTFATTVSDFEQFAKDTDSNVATIIDTLADNFIGNRNWLQKCGDWIYNTFCVEIPNEFAIFRVFKYAANLYSQLQDVKKLVVRKVYDWFKYGNGKYVLKIAKAVIGTVAAIAGLIAAIVALPVTGGATLPLVIGIVGLIATGIGTIITIGNTVATIGANGKAIKLDIEGKDGAARYYSDSTKISDVLDKYDFGGEKENGTAKNVGYGIDLTKEVSDDVALVCSIMNLGVVHDYNKGPNAVDKYVNKGKFTEGYKFSADNVCNNLLHEMGFESKYGLTKLKKGSWTSFLDKSDLSKYKLPDTNLGKCVLRVFNTNKTANNFIKAFGAFEGLHEVNTSDNYDESQQRKLFKNLSTLTGMVKPLKPLYYFNKIVERGIYGNDFY